VTSVVVVDVELEVDVEVDVLVAAGATVAGTVDSLSVSTGGTG
jgi:hypothetical protein